LKILLLYNPIAGNGTFVNHLDKIIKTVQDNGYYLIPYRLSTIEALQQMLLSFDLKSVDRIWIAGGDGTIHNVVNAVYPLNPDVPLGIFPVGTANDFAYYFEFPSEILKMTNILLSNNFTYCDIGVANNRYFLNVASMGSLVDVSQKTDKKFKNVLGLLAYYLKGAEELTHLKPVEIKINCQERNFHDEIYFMLIMNGKSAGGFRKIAPYASVTDGLLDVYIFKKCPLYELFPLLIKIANGEHTDSRYVDYFQTKEMTIDCAETIGTDMDGEKGFDYPLKVSVKQRKLKLITGLK